MEEKNHIFKALLDNLVSKDNADLSDSKILKVSNQFDILIAKYYIKSRM